MSEKAEGDRPKASVGDAAPEHDSDIPLLTDVAPDPQLLQDEEALDRSAVAQRDRARPKAK